MLKLAESPLLTIALLGEIEPFGPAEVLTVKVVDPPQ